MPSINMIAARRAEKLKLERLVRIMLLVIAGEVFITVALVGFMTGSIYSANGRIRQLDSDLKTVEPTVKQIQGYESQIKALEPKLKLLAESREQTLMWHSILKDLSGSMPEKTWIRAVSTTESVTNSPDGKSSKTEKVLNLQGASVSQAHVGEAMLRLNQCPEFENVNLGYTQTGGDKDFQTVEFQMVLSLKSSEPEKGGTSANASN